MTAVRNVYGEPGEQSDLLPIREVVATVYKGDGDTYNVKITVRFADNVIDTATRRVEGIEYGKLPVEIGGYVKELVDRTAKIRAEILRAKNVLEIELRTTANNLGYYGRVRVPVRHYFKLLASHLVGPFDYYSRVESGDEEKVWIAFNDNVIRVVTIPVTASKGKEDYYVEF